MRLPFQRRKTRGEPAVIPPVITEAAEKTYSPDEPITSRQGDRFNRWPFAERIAETLARRQDVSSIVIGIYGAWGGKTSVLRLMEEALNKHDATVVVHFNPWHFQSESHLVRSFFQTLADALSKKLTTKAEEIGTALTQYGAVLSLASVSILGGTISIKPGDSMRRRGCGPDDPKRR